MQTVWTLNGSRRLILFFTGWAMDENPTRHLRTSCDVCTCFHYDTLQTAEWKRWRSYDTVILVVWSMGVWAAENLFAQIATEDLPGWKPDAAIAINGTPYPVDDQFGIPVAIAQRTCKNLTPATMERFQRRVFGGATLHQAMADALPEIDCEQRKKELERIVAEATTAAFPENQEAYRIRWDRTLISGKDAIFPPENMRRYWQGRCEITLLEAPHYPFHLFQTWEEILHHE